MNGLRIGSLFSGIGGLELGLEQAGVGHTVFHVERDPYACAVLGKRWPGVPCYHDIRDVGAGNLPACDVLVGGFPCQDVSNAGKRRGIKEGTRSGLWFEFARLIGELRPRLVVVENVAALLNRGIDRVLGDLAALGYDARWQVVSASSVGAWHQRERLFIIAAPAGRLGAPIPDARSLGLMGGGPRLEEMPRVGERPGLDSGPSCHAVPDPYGERELQSEGRKPDQRGRLGDVSQEVPDANGSRLEIREGVGSDPCGGGSAVERNGGARPSFWESEPSLGRVADGVSARVDRLRCLGNAVVPEVARRIGVALVKRGWCA